MKKRVTVVVLLIIIVGIGYYLSLNPANSKGNTGKVVSKSKNTTVQQTIAASNGTDEVDLSKVAWARDYFKKYIGKVDETMLLDLNDNLTFAKKMKKEDFTITSAIDYINNKNKEFYDKLKTSGYESELSNICNEVCNDDSLPWLKRLGLVMSYAQSKSEWAKEILLNKYNNMSNKDGDRIFYLRLLVEDYPKSSGKLVAKVISDKNDSLRTTAVHYCVQVSDESLNKVLLNAYNDPAFKDERYRIVNGLRNQPKNKEVAKLMVEIINKKEGEFWYGAIEGLSTHDPRKARKYIKKYLVSSDQCVRGAAIVASMNNKDEEIIKLLLKNMENPNLEPSVAALSLQNVENPTFIDEVREYAKTLKYTDYAIVNICGILGKAKDKESLQFLKKTLQQMKEKNWIKSDIEKMQKIVDEIEE